MEFNLNKTIEILERTPRVLKALLSDLPDEWTLHNEGPETWSPFDILGHLIVGEQTDWIPRMQMILSESVEAFPPFDMKAQFEASQGKTMAKLLEEFSEWRAKNVEVLKATPIDDAQLNKTGIHPEFGEVKLKDMLATWTVHDLGHIAQISRVMAKQYKTEVGPWIQYLGILK
ncbi:MAG: hypothetical protein CMB80_07660 [Flammeovirgaceae bacterium]|nr:hypothetical protein [Flammeovirgaceae bacterium]HCX20705.1 hypothetical protein [Cytophagales bacterium]|tara:strand:- start:32960 stop:33478 length:519 start_codon:yes stop_codon:yes gene_type:complete